MFIVMAPREHQAPSGAASLARRDGWPLMPLLTELGKGVGVGVSINTALLPELFANSAVKQKEHKQQNERKSMNNKFDELTKSMAQSVTRRAALKKFGVGLAGMALACFGLANKAEADPRPPSPCIGRQAICCEAASSGQIKQCPKQCQQQCCSGTYFLSEPGVYICA